MLLMLLTVSCIGSSAIKGSGKAARGEFDISTNYTELSVSSGITVRLVASDKPMGTIVADEMVIDYVSITEKEGTVMIKYDPQVSVNSGVETVVTIPVSGSLARLEATSAATLKSDVQIAVQSLTVESSSAAKVVLDVKAGKITVNVGSAAVCNITGICEICKISGGSAAKFTGSLIAREYYSDFNSAANCWMEGAAEYCKINVDSAANFNGYDFICRKADIDANSAGSVKITAVEELVAKVSSGASVKYKGEPHLTSRDVSSAGSLKKID